MGRWMQSFLFTDSYDRVVLQEEEWKGRCEVKKGTKGEDRRGQGGREGGRKGMDDNGEMKEAEIITESKTSTCVSSTKNASNKRAVMAAPSASTKKAALTATNPLACRVR